MNAFFPVIRTKAIGPATSRILSAHEARRHDQYRRISGRRIKEKLLMIILALPAFGAYRAASGLVVLGSVITGDIDTIVKNTTHVCEVTSNAS